MYLDSNATTKIHPLIVEEMIKIYQQPFNASSIHFIGRKGKMLIERSRQQVKTMLGLEKNERKYRVIFTSSGTEANGLILNNFNNIITSEIEHNSVLKNLFNKNFKLISVNNDGIVNLDELEKQISEQKAKSTEHILVSVMWANNETGIIQPMQQIREICTKYNVLLHSDMVQIPGKVDFNFVDLDLDFATISAHKFNGPQGVAALIAKEKYHLQPLILGGGQERGSRSGTENIAAIVGFGLAAEIVANKNIAKDIALTNKLKKEFEDKIKAITNKALIVSENAERLANTSLIIMPGIDSQTQLMNFDIAGFCLSSGAACSSGKVEASHVLKAYGYDDELAKSALRFSFTMGEEYDIQPIISKWQEIYNRLLT